jgi:hypothetical protein
MQLVAYGAQDVYLTGNPQITFWKVTYRRHTNFAMESIEQTFNGQADFGRRVTCTISRNGDLAYRTYLQVTLPEINQQMANAGDLTPGGGTTVAGAFVPNGGLGDGGSTGVPPNVRTGVYARWLDNPGLQLISQVEVEIGGQRIDRQYGDWMNIWNQLTQTSEQERGYNSMIGQTTQLTYITDPGFDDVDGPCESNAPRQVCAPRNALPETTLYVPLQFWYCRNPGLALPLIALQYHEVKINMDLRPIDECLWAVSSLYCADVTMSAAQATAAATQMGGVFPQPQAARTGVSGTRVTAAYGQSLVAASLYVDYVFLDTDERRRMAQNPHEYLIEQLQFTGDESVGSSSNKIKLNFNHPCKELIWVVQPDENVDYCSSLDCNQTLFKLLGAQPFNYTDAVDALPNAHHAFGSKFGLVGFDAQDHYTSGNFITSEGLFQQAGAGNADGVTGNWSGMPQGNFSQIAALLKGAAPGAGPGAVGVTVDNDTVPAGNDAPNRIPTATDAALGKNVGADSHVNVANAYSANAVSDAGTFVLAETALDMHCWGQNPVVVGKLQLNGQDRFSEREGGYFDVVQPYQHHTRNPDTGINVYSFALRPEEHQPSGTCNFSRIDNATLQLVLSNATVEGTKTAKVRVYATNYNVLRVMSGMGGLAYSN